jgi:hypothetical protein
LVGPAPYGAHLFGCALYLATCVVLYRTVRPRFGRVPAAIGLTLLLFLPSLFAWSISVLKEPLYFLLAALSVWLIDRAGRPAAWSTRVIAIVAIVAIAISLQSIREVGLAMLVAGVGGGFVLAFVLRHSRLAMAVAVALPATLVALAIQPRVQIAFDHAFREFARIHAGHIMTAGYTYKLLDSRLYEQSIQSISVPEEARFAVRALAAYVAQPTPWSIQSRAALAYMPEQVVWYVMVALIPLGIGAGARRDVLLTCVLAMYAAAAALMVALTGGNIGTLVRHRGLALPYLVWFVGLGVARSLESFGARHRSRLNTPV